MSQNQENYLYVQDLGELRLPRIHDLALAEQLVVAGLIGSVEEIYTPLTPELEPQLAEKRHEWKKQEIYLTNDFDWK